MTVTGQHVQAEYRAAMRRRALADGTIKARMSELYRWIDFVGTWETADRHQIETWLDGRPLGLRARYSAISHLSAFYRWAIREELVDRDPTVLIERPRLPQRLPRPVTVDQVDRLLEELGAPVRLAALLMVDAGLRCCEVVRLRWADVDLEGPTLYVYGKGARERLVGVPRRLRMALYLAAADQTGEFVIGRSMTPARLSQLFGFECRQAGLHGVTAHRLRHTYATRLYRATGGDLRAVQQALGHSSVATTAIYAAIDVDRVVAAAQLLD